MDIGLNLGEIFRLINFPSIERMTLLAVINAKWVDQRVVFLPSPQSSKQISLAFELIYYLCVPRPPPLSLHLNAISVFSSDRSSGPEMRTDCHALTAIM